MLGDRTPMLAERIRELVSTAAAQKPLPITAWLETESQEFIWGIGLEQMRKLCRQEYASQHVTGKEVVAEIFRLDLVHIIETDLDTSKKYLPHAVWLKLHARDFKPE